jgi:hypothetical protein
MSNGLDIEEPVIANLVFQQSNDGGLKLAWDFTIYQIKITFGVLEMML